MKHLSNIKDAPVGDFWTVFNFTTRNEHDYYSKDGSGYTVDHCEVRIFTDFAELKKWIIDNKDKKFTVQECSRLNFTYNVEVKIDLTN